MSDDNRDLTLKVTGLGHKLTLKVPETASIEDVKKEIETRTSLPASYQRLLSRGKTLGDGNVHGNPQGTSLVELGIENRTSFLLLHSQAYAADKKALDELAALEDEIEKLAANATSMSPTVVHELVTQVCCKLDSVDTHGSESLRSMRKTALQRAQAIEEDSTHRLASNEDVVDQQESS